MAMTSRGGGRFRSALPKSVKKRPPRVCPACGRKWRGPVVPMHGPGRHGELICPGTPDLGGR